jgi:hypothetical protein
MPKQHFTVILKGKDSLTEEVVEQLYAQCDHASAGSCNGIGHVHFDRPAASLNEAIVSAVADLRGCGLEVERIEIEADDLTEMVQATA